jgi:hypothetical protein
MHAPAFFSIWLARPARSGGETHARATMMAMTHRKKQTEGEDNTPQTITTKKSRRDLLRSPLLLLTFVCVWSSVGFRSV